MSWNTNHIAPFDIVEVESDTTLLSLRVFSVEPPAYQGNLHVGVGNTTLESWVDVAKIKNVIKSKWEDVHALFNTLIGKTIFVYLNTDPYYSRISVCTKLCVTLTGVDALSYHGDYHLHVMMEDGTTDWISYKDVIQTHLFTIPSPIVSWVQSFTLFKSWVQSFTLFNDKQGKKINFRIITQDSNRNCKSYNEHFEPEKDLIGKIIDIEDDNYAGDYHLLVRLEDGTEDWISYKEYVSDHICEPETVGLVQTPQPLKNIETNSVICDNSNISDVQIQRAIDQIHFIRTTQPKVELTMQNQQTDVITTVTAQIKQASIINAKIVAGKGALEIVSNVVKRQLPENMQHFVEHPLFSALCASVLCALQVQFLANNPKAQLISESIILAGTNNVMSMLNLEQLVSGLFDQFTPLLENIPTDVINTDK